MVLVALAILLLTIGYVFVDRLTTEKAIQPSIAQLTFGEGLQTHATWSPDGRFVAFAWNRDGNFDLFIQALDGSEPIRLTDHPAHDTQPSWSPDGREIVFRSERDGGGLFIVPAFGGPARRICSFGWRPAWSPDGSLILFWGSLASSPSGCRPHLTNRDGYFTRPIGEGFITVDVCWHPSGDIALRGVNLKTMNPGLNLIPLKGGPPLVCHIGTHVSSPDRPLNVGTIRWSPKGDEVYFEAHSEGVTNLWRLAIDPDRFLPRGQAQRLTRGPSLDTDIAVSPSGQRLAFTSQTRRSYAKLYPFDVAEGRVTGEGRRVGQFQLNVFGCELSPGGERLLLVGSKAAALSVAEDREICEVSLADEQQVVPIDRGLVSKPTWSRDGKFLVYRRLNVYDEQKQRIQWGEYWVVMRPAGGGTSRILSHTKERHFVPEDWSRDGAWLLCSTRDRPESESSPQLVKLLATDGSQRSSAAILSHSDYDILSPRFSPDDRWISFVAVSRKDRKTAHLYLAPASGGNWIPMIPEEENVSQLHWSPDGRLVYCLSQREAGAVVLAVPVDPRAGRPSAAPLQVMDFDQLGCLPEDVGTVGFCVAPGHLVVRKIERTGNIWMTTTRPD
ncbi:MAG: hypothetical protein EHM23_27770 [Acidobacteria bacterium]|nr:MAG: hypothetical protein EHM23_27770 [Acidobacteriota bacterium]